MRIKILDCDYIRKEKKFRRLPWRIWLLLTCIERSINSSAKTFHKRELIKRIRMRKPERANQNKWGQCAICAVERGWSADSRSARTRAQIHEGVQQPRDRRHHSIAEARHLCVRQGASGSNGEKQKLGTQVTRTESGEVRGEEEYRVHMERILLLELHDAFTSSPAAVTQTTYYNYVYLCVVY